MKRLLLLPLISCVISGFAQSKLAIKAPDTLAFILAIGDEQVNNLPCTFITVAEVASERMTAHLSFPARKTIEINQDLILKANTSYLFEVAVVKGKHKLSMVSESSFIPVAKTEETAFQPTPADSAITDSIFVPVEVGDCVSPVTKENFEEFRLGLSELPFEAGKLNRMLAFSIENCIRVEQLNVLLSQLAMEDNKLKLLDTAASNIFDQGHLEESLGQFLLEKNKVKAEQIIQRVRAN